MSFLTSLFAKPKIPSITAATPPAPPQNPQMEAEMAQAGRQQGLLSALFGLRSPSGTSGSAHTMTGQSGR